MFVTFEVSRPIQWRPYFHRENGITTARFTWLLFSVSLHPMRFDELLSLAMSGHRETEDGPCIVPEGIGAPVR